MRRKTWFIIIVLVGLLGFGVYAFCIPCQYFGYKRLPSVEEVLANPSVKPATMGEVYYLSPPLCMTVNFNPIIKRHPEKDIYQDHIEQWRDLDQAYRQSIQYFVDNWRQVNRFASLLTEYESADPCVDIDQIAAGYHVAHMSFEAPLGQTHQYTWVFEVTADGVVPEVTATAGA